jgi:hypothetical protein
MTHLPDKRAAEETLKIERDIGLEAPRLAQPRKQVRRHAEATELAARKNVGMVDTLVTAQERSPFGVDDPGNFRFRVGVTEEGDGGQGVHNVAQRTWFDNQDGADR